MKTGETWKHKDGTIGKAIEINGRLILAWSQADGCGAIFPETAEEFGIWHKTHEADGTPVMPEPQPGELWQFGDDVLFVIDANRLWVLGCLADGSHITSNKMPRRRLYPPTEEAK